MRRRGPPARRTAWGVALGILLLSATAAAAACDPAVAEIRTPTGAVARFGVEIADDPEERARGLMFRDHLPASAGMLFVYEEPQPVAFWMRNTLIPLDMVFFDDRGIATRVHADAVPGDERAIDGGPGILAVLEIRGGLAARLGIVAGSELRHPALDPDTAAWSCAAP